MSHSLCHDCDREGQRGPDVCAGCKAYEIIKNNQRFQAIVVLMCLAGMAFSWCIYP